MMRATIISIITAIIQFPGGYTTEGPQGTPYATKHSPLVSGQFDTSCLRRATVEQFFLSGLAAEISRLTTANCLASRKRSVGVSATRSPIMAAAIATARTASYEYRHRSNNHHQ